MMVAAALRNRLKTPGFQGERSVQFREQQFRRIVRKQDDFSLVRYFQGADGGCRVHTPPPRIGAPIRDEQPALRTAQDIQRSRARRPPAPECPRGEGASDAPTECRFPGPNRLSCAKCALRIHPTPPRRSQSRAVPRYRPPALLRTRFPKSVCRSMDSPPLCSFGSVISENKAGSAGFPRRVRT